MTIGRVLARDVFVFARRTGTEVENLSHYLTAWVTPNDESLGPVVQGAQRRRVMKGYLSDPETDDATVTREQVKAIYQTLKEDIGVAYSNATTTHDQEYNYAAQRVRLPKETMAIHGANCIDGSVVFASLFEYFSMQPLIVLMPGHAFVGWKVWKNADHYEFLETTLLKEADFETAHAAGQRTFDKLQEKGFFRRLPFDPAGFALLIDVTAIKGAKHPVLLDW